jgi:hypothetical protein
MRFACVQTVLCCNTVFEKVIFEQLYNYFNISTAYWRIGEENKQRKCSILFNAPHIV